ncbi:MAG: hypothetical protein ACI9MX_000823 [Candidatus Aldehydirespiratoraceae bacterium]|jgi:hypothetical protein
MKRLLLALTVSMGLLLAACGSSSDPSPADSAVGGDGNTTNSGEVGGSSSGSGGEAIPFDAAALSGEVLNVTDLMPLDRSGGTPPPAVTPVIDTCAALTAAEMEAIVTDVATEFSFGQELDFEATALGAACEYTSENHRVRVTVGSMDEVNTSLDSPAMSLPAGAGDVRESASVDDGAVVILSEDSFGLDTSFAAYTTADSYGLMVSNVAGTGIDYGATGALYARIASAASAGVSEAGAPSEAAETQMANVAADPCAIWTVSELDGFLTEAPITRSSDSNVTDGCQWSNEDATANVQLSALPPDTVASEAYSPIADGSEVHVNAINGRVLVISAGFVVEIDTRFSPDGGATAYDSATANIALAENILARLA